MRRATVIGTCLLACWAFADCTLNPQPLPPCEMCTAIGGRGGVDGGGNPISADASVPTTGNDASADSTTSTTADGAPPHDAGSSDALTTPDGGTADAGGLDAGSPVDSSDASGDDGPSQEDTPDASRWDVTLESTE